jgi:2-oxoglutarate ferredoxin oxidoreductase subunit gamma
MISEDRVGSPVTHRPSSLVAMNKASLDRFEEDLQAGGFLLINSSLIDREPQRADLHVIKIPANKIAEEAGTLQVTNMAALGAYVGAKKVVAIESVIRALQRMIPAHRKELLSINESALQRGYEAALGKKG